MELHLQGVSKPVVWTIYAGLFLDFLTTVGTSLMGIPVKEAVMQMGHILYRGNGEAKIPESTM